MRGGSAAIDTQTSNLLQSARSAKSAGDTLAKPQTHEVPNEKRAPRAFHQHAEGHQPCREHRERHPNGWSAPRTNPMRGGSAAIDTQTSNLLQSARSAKSAGDTLAKPQTHEV